jgi:hypothetical protein
MKRVGPIGLNPLSDRDATTPPWPSWAKSPRRLRSGIRQLRQAGQRFGDHGDLSRGTRRVPGYAAKCHRCHAHGTVGEAAMKFNEIVRHLTVW